ncbi:hypothetical protein K8I61_09420, partial [bacterium]|nr:hypothetical protein [bacterium]
LRTEVRDAIILEMARVLASAGRDVRRGVIGGFGAMAPADDATPLSAWRALPADTARKIAQATGAAFFDATPFLDTGDVDARQDRLAQWMVLNL